MLVHTLYALRCLGFTTLDSEIALRTLLTELAARSTPSYGETWVSHPFPGSAVMIQLDFFGEPQYVKVRLSSPAQSIIPFEVSPLDEWEALVFAFTSFCDGVGEAFCFIGEGPQKEARLGKPVFAKISAFAESLEPFNGGAEKAGFGEPRVSGLISLRGVVLDVQHLENRLTEGLVTVLDIWVPGLRMPLVFPKVCSPEVGTLVIAQAVLLGDVLGG